MHYIHFLILHFQTNAHFTKRKTPPTLKTQIENKTKRDFYAYSTHGNHSNIATNSINAHSHDAAIKNRDVIRAESLLLNLSNPNIRNRQKQTPLHYISQYLLPQQTEILQIISTETLSIPRFIEILTQKGAKLDAKDEDGYTPLHTAVIYGNYTAANHLLKHGANPNVPDISSAHDLKHESALHMAVDNCDVYMVDILATHDASLDIEDENSDTPLHYASKLGYTGIIHKLVSYGAPIYNPNWEISPLHIAAKKGNTEATYILLKAGANPNEKTEAIEEGETPLHIATRDGKDSATVELLLQFGADVNEQNQFGDTPLHLITDETIDIGHILIHYGADVNAINTQIHGNTPLHETANSNNPDAALLLASYGAYMDAHNTSGQTPAMLAEQLDEDDDNEEMLELLHHRWNTPLEHVDSSAVRTFIRSSIALGQGNAKAAINMSKGATPEVIGKIKLHAEMLYACGIHPFAARAYIQHTRYLDEKTTTYHMLRAATNLIHKDLLTHPILKHLRAYYLQDIYNFLDENNQSLFDHILHHNNIHANKTLESIQGHETTKTLYQQQKNGNFCDISIITQ